MQAIFLFFNYTNASLDCSSFMKRPKIFRKMSPYQYWAFIWFFLVPMSIYLVGGLIMLIVTLIDRK